MNRYLRLVFAGPLQSFGTTRVDEWGPTQDFPGLSMITGILANALGWRRTQSERLEALQDAVVYAARIDRPGALLTDFQIADLRLPHMQGAWMTDGTFFTRTGTATQAPHPRQRQYWADRVVTIVLALDRAAPVELSQIARALQFPARGLYLGRKGCVPAEPIYQGVIDAPDLAEALRIAPLHPRSRSLDGRFPALLPGPMDRYAGRPWLEPEYEDILPDRCDWANYTHTGGSLVTFARLRLPSSKEWDEWL